MITSVLFPRVNGDDIWMQWCNAISFHRNKYAFSLFLSRQTAVTVVACEQNHRHHIFIIIVVVIIPVAVWDVNLHHLMWKKVVVLRVYKKRLKREKMFSSFLLCSLISLQSIKRILTTFINYLQVIRCISTGLYKFDHLS